jgi:chorismate mutase
VAADEPHAILLATQELLEEIVSQNGDMKVEEIASALFTLTEDLCSAYPAAAARQMGWDEVPMICSSEIPMPSGLPRIIRVLILWNTDLPQSSIRHVYLHDAARLRPDLAPSEKQG